MSNIINLNILPREILNQIPLSLKLNKEYLDFNNLSPKLKYLLIDYIEVKEEGVLNNNVYDIIPQISLHGDLTNISTKKKLVLEYIRNFISVSKGSYPFDPEIGSILKTLLQSKSDSLKKTLFSNELAKIINEIRSIFKIPIVVESYLLEEQNNGISNSYNLILNLKIEEEPLKVGFIV